MASNKYWEQEQPETIDTGKNILKHYRQAGKLQVSMPNWTDSEGNSKPGKTITLDLAAIKATTKAVEMLKGIATDDLSLT